MGREPPRRPKALTGRRLRLKVWLAMVPVATLLGFSSTPTDAQPIRYGISPGEIELVPPPGGTASAVLVVYNKAPNTARMRVAVQDLYVRPDGVADVLAPGKLSWSVARFTRVQPAEFDLEPERQMPVRIAVTVPPDARGGLYGMIVVTSTPVLQTPAAGKGTFVVVAPKLAARLLVAIRGTEVVQGAIVNMLAAPRPRGAGADIRVAFRNKGNVHLHTRGEVEILDASGQRLGKVPLPEAVVLPASTREFKISWDKSLGPGTYTARAVIDYGADVLVSGELSFAYRGP